MNWSAVSELIRIFVDSYQAGLLWTLIAAIPFGSSALLRLYRGCNSVLYRSSMYATVAACLFWLWSLISVDGIDVEAAVNSWFLLFLYYFLPVWLLLWSVLGTTTVAYRKLAGIKPAEAEEQDDEKR